ncbi:MAG: rhodanese-related sulfurtransferase [Candidatus Dojkabacteria bacterium]|nr:rhodanese-related sulfurtransferase [Candidatus Dojkabacteria bacterium]
MHKYQILLYYKYVYIADPQRIRDWQENLCRQLNLKGRIIVAQEGINGTVEGLVENTEEYIREMNKNSIFVDIVYKKSIGTGDAFPRLSVKVRPEIVSLHLDNENFYPWEVTGKYITAEELFNWYIQNKEFYVVDMRNDYEHRVGYFEKSILLPLKNFRDLPNVVHSISHLKDKTIVTVCTGGVRCEKGSGYLIKKVFKYVYQLKDGIVTFMEKFPNKYFLGKLFVFDKRVVIGFNIDSQEHVIVSKCERCGTASDNYVNCAYLHCKNIRRFIVCQECLKKDTFNSYCSVDCFTKDSPK